MTKIRAEEPKDVQGVREILLRAFGQPQEADVVDALRRECAGMLSLVAVVDSRVVGHVLFSPATLEGEGRKVEGMGLAPVAVLPEYQKKGIGSALVRAGLAQLQSTPCPFVIVLGYPDYYRRFDFEPASRYGIASEWDVPDEAFMIRILDGEVMQGISGVARYRAEFAQAM
ncbi:MAG: N-acetyltransferase [Sedimentisphaerales bacterium]|nr:N-acetyltransferase [Sedimentisphaerales bacterium]